MDHDGWTNVATLSNIHERSLFTSRFIYIRTQKYGKTIRMHLRPTSKLGYLSSKGFHKSIQRTVRRESYESISALIRRMKEQLAGLYRARFGIKHRIEGRGILFASLRV